MTKVIKRAIMSSSDDLREFFIIVRQALLLVVAWIERKYQLTRKKND